MSRRARGLRRLLPVALGMMIGALAMGVVYALLAIAFSSYLQPLIVMVATRTAGVLRSRPAVETAARWLAGTLLFGLGVRMASSS